MYASELKKKATVNYISLRTKNLNIEDTKGNTILMYMLMQENFKMASRLILRGANIEYVNKSGKTVLHLCVE